MQKEASENVIFKFKIFIVMARMDIKENGKMGLATIGFVLISDLLSGVVGVTVAALIKPG